MTRKQNADNIIISLVIKTKSMPNSDENKTGTFSEFERKAMQERAKELREEAKNAKNRAKGEEALKNAISEMSQNDKSIVTRIHELVMSTASELFPKTWYGMPAYANKDGKVICFFQAASKYQTRYSSFGFNDAANLDEGNMWPTSFAITKLTKAEEERIVELLKKAIS